MKTYLIIAGTFLLFTDMQTRFEGSRVVDGATTVSCTPLQQNKGLQGKWYLQPVLPSDTAAGKFPFLDFNLGRKIFIGHTGCNNMSGSFTRTDTSLVFGKNIKVSRMICTGYNEQAFLKNLLSTTRYELQDTVLILYFQSTELSRWTRKPSRSIVIKQT